MGKTIISEDGRFEWDENYLYNDYFKKINAWTVNGNKKLSR